MYIDAIENAQRVLRAYAGYAGPIDGDPGALSVAAADRVEAARGLPPSGAPWTPARRVIAAAQVALREAGHDAGPADGYYGPQTDFAYLAWRAVFGAGPALPSRDRPGDFGRQADVVRRFGARAAPICTAGRVVMPWRTVLAWNPAEEISYFACHEAVAASAQRVLNHVATIYSRAEIEALGLHLYGGCFSDRPMRGGSQPSMHAYGLAVDFDPARNRLNWGADCARLAEPDAAPWWDAWEAEGWTSLGRARNFDWMHVQAPAL